jgi:hypothetical protein
MLIRNSVMPEFGVPWQKTRLRRSFCGYSYYKIDHPISMSSAVTIPQHPQHLRIVSNKVVAVITLYYCSVAGPRGSPTECEEWENSEVYLYRPPFSSIVWYTFGYSCRPGFLPRRGHGIAISIHRRTCDDSPRSV